MLKTNMNEVTNLRANDCIATSHELYSSSILFARVLPSRTSSSSFVSHLSAVRIHCFQFVRKTIIIRVFYAHLLQETNAMPSNGCDCLLGL
jgi:hypothetical protein